MAATPTKSASMSPIAIAHANAAAAVIAREVGLDPDAPEIRALMKVTRDLAERIIWEVVPELAEQIIRENLEQLAKR